MITYWYVIYNHKHQENIWPYLNRNNFNSIISWTKRLLVTIIGDGRKQRSRRSVCIGISLSTVVAPFFPPPRKGPWNKLKMADIAPLLDKWYLHHLHAHRLPQISMGILSYIQNSYSKADPSLFVQTIN